jgi:hypothetical protein
MKQWRTEGERGGRPPPGAGGRGAKIGIKTQEKANVRQHCATLADFYENDIDGTELFAEISDCSMLLKSRLDAATSSPLEF